MNPETLLDAVVREAVRWANDEYNRQISAPGQNKRRANRDQAGETDEY